jgi:endonuclease/exonuclease/phosphatase (EEP) superfamily protein YafD
LYGGDVLEAALWALGGIVVLATVLPFIRGPWWWVRVCDFPRLQLFVLGFAVLVALLVLGPRSAADWLGAAVLAAAVLYQGYRILPYTPLWSVRALPSRDPDPERKLRLLIANVLVKNRRSEALLRLVRATDPDVLLAVETDRFWVDALACLDARFAWRVKLPQDNAYGMLLLSRLELRDARVRHLMDEDVPRSPRAWRFAAATKSTSMRFIRARPRPSRPAPTATPRFCARARDPRARRAGDRRRRPQRRRLVARHASVSPRQRHARPAYRTRPVRHLQRAAPAAALAARPHLLHWDFRLVRLERMGFIGSDHFPILVELSYEPALAEEQEARVMVPGDRAMVRRKIRRARAS